MRMHLCLTPGMWALCLVLEDAVVGGQRVIVRVERLYALGFRPLRLAVA